MSARNQNHELWYAEAKQGLDITSTGFTTVKRTQGIPTKLQRHMEQLSCYDNYSQFKNHVRCCFSKCSDGADTWFVLSRASAAVGYSQRAGFFCHHVAIHQSNRPRCNPASLFNSNLFAGRWDGKVEELAQCRPIPPVRESVDSCGTWASIFGDAGAAGDAIIRARRNRSIYIPFHDPAHAISLAEEALSVLPTDKMWQFTFTTYLASDVERDACVMKFFPSPAPKHLSIPKQQLFSFNASRYANDAPPEVIAARSGNNLDIVLAAQTKAAQSNTGLELDSGIPMATLPEDSLERGAQNRGVNDNPPTLPGKAAVQPIHPGGVPTIQTSSHKDRKRETTTSSIAMGLLGLVAGLAIAIGSCLPFVFSYKHKFETEVLAKKGLEQQLLVAKQASEKGNNDIEGLEGDVKSWRVQFEELTEARNELAKEKQLLEQTEVELTEELELMDEETAKNQKTIEEQVARIKELETQVAKLIDGMADDQKKMDDGKGKEKNPDEANNEKVADNPDAPRADPTVEYAVDIWRPETKHRVAGPFRSLRVDNWPSSRQKEKGKFGFETQNDGKRMLLFAGTYHFATVMHQDNGFGDELVFKWNQDGFRKTANFWNKPTTRIQRRLAADRIGFKYLDDAEGKENLIRLKIIDSKKK
ncbi:MAG: hypothetical protein AB8B55_13765 [Mariniblastus sp.]